MSREDMLADLAYARSLAEEGRQAPLLAGAYLVFWGLLNIAAWVVQWALLTERLPHEPYAFGLLWGGYGLVAIIGMILLSWRARDKPGRTTIGVRAERAIWLAAALGMAALSLGSMLRTSIDQDVTAPNVIMGVGFAMYGVALFGTALLSQTRWMTGFGLACFVVSAALSAYANAPIAYLIAAAGSAIVLVIPGLILLRNEPSAIV